MLRCHAALLVLLASTSLLFGQQIKVLAPHRPIAPRLPDNPPKTGPLRSMVGGLWMIDANFKSTIYIKNSVEIAPVTVTPILYLSNGKKVTLADVTLEPSGTATVSVNDGLNANGISPWSTLNGYVEIQYKWPWDPLCVTVTSVDVIHSVIFTNGLRPLEPMNPSARAMLVKGPGAQIIEGMWWKQEPQVTGFVALSNTTAQVIKAQLQVNDAAGQSIGQHAVTVSPHGTKTVNLEELLSASGTAGGLRVTFNGGMNDLLPNGGLQDPATGYSASVPFATPHGLHPEESTQTYAELGLMSGIADPMMQFPAGTTFVPYSLLRNVGEQPATVTPSIYWMEGGTARSSRLQTMKLQPYQTHSFDVPALLSLAGLQNFNGSFNLIFDVEGSVLIASGSVDQKNTYVFEVMPESVKESASKGLAYWSTKNGDDSMVTIWNPADEDQDLVFTLFFSGGHYDLPVHLGPRATRMFNISEILQNQIPDKDGTLIPPSVHEGSARISGTHAENEHILVAVDAGIYNVRKATCGYTCKNCNGMVSSQFISPGWAVAAGGNTQLSFKATWNTGTQYDLTNGSAWTSNSQSIATVSAGLTHGVANGSATISADFINEPWAGQQCGSPPPACPRDQGAVGSGGGNVGPYKVEPIATASQFPASCPQGQAGWNRNVTNQLQYANGNAFAVSGVSVADTITVGSRHDLGSGTSTGSATTTGDGSFSDNYSVCSTACPSTGETDALQNWTAGSYPLPHANALVYKCSSITIDGQ